MKAISTIWMLLLVLGLMVSPCFAIEYCKDFLESGNPGGWTASLKTFEDEWTMIIGDEVELDIWINDVPLSLLSGGFWIEYDPSMVSIVSVAAYDGNDIPEPGPWEVAFTIKVPDAGGPGTYMLSVAPPLMPAAPDGDGDIIIAKVRFRCESEGDSTITISTIPGLDTFVGDTTVFDYDIFPNEIVIHQEIDYCEGDFDNDGDQDGSDAATFKLDFGRSIFLNPCTNDNSCNSDFDCDVDVDGSDAAIFKEDFGRSPFFHPCLFYPRDPWCIYEGDPFIKDYSDTGCLGGSSQSSSAQEGICANEDRVTAEVMGNSIIVASSIYGNCCSGIEVELTVDGNDLHLFMIENPPGTCFCTCCFGVETEIAGLAAGEYTVEMCWYDWGSGLSCEIETVVIYE